MESSSRRSASSLPLLSESSKCRSMTSTVLRSVKRVFSCSSEGSKPKRHAPKDEEGEDTSRQSCMLTQ
eukprot:1075550-Pleurochrysis_carterae.AAC.1